MAVYDWRDFERISGDGLQTLVRRYDEASGAKRVKAWQDFVTELLELLPLARDGRGHEAIDASVDRFRERASTAPRPKKTTVFVSHQRKDAHWAERAAWEASELGLDYWLDIHDPGLKRAPSLPAPIQAALIAVIIEMALLNCTHIVSMQTTHARGSRWVPYELGRAKQWMTIATNASSWFEKGIWLDPGGDYLALTFCARQDTDLYAWLGHVAGSTARVHPNTIWRGTGTPGPLPN